MRALSLSICTLSFPSLSVKNPEDSLTRVEYQHQWPLFSLQRLNPKDWLQKRHVLVPSHYRFPSWIRFALFFRRCAAARFALSVDSSNEREFTRKARSRWSVYVSPVLSLRKFFSNETTARTKESLKEFCIAKQQYNLFVQFYVFCLDFPHVVIFFRF